MSGKLRDRVLIDALEKKDAGAVAALIPQLTQTIIDPGGMEGRIAELVDDSRSQWVVARMAGLVVGFGGLAWYTIPSKGKIGWIEEVVVDRNIRDRGIGRKIVEYLLIVAALEKIQKVKLTAKPHLRAFYERHGFAAKGEEYMVR